MPQQIQLLLQVTLAVNAAWAFEGANLLAFRLLERGNHESECIGAST
jgi:hypothetical protein